MTTALKKPDGYRVLICIRGLCADPASGLRLERQLQALVAAHGLDDPTHPRHISVRVTNCLGICADGPVLIVHPGSVKYRLVDEATLLRIFHEHLLADRPVAAYQIPPTSPRRL